MAADGPKLEKGRKTRSNRGGEETRAALISAGLKLFGAQGFDATSTRQLASEAQANIAAIAYHFGGKEGLRAACAELVADRLAQVLKGADLLAGQGSDPENAVRALENAVTALSGFLLGTPQAREIATFILSEVRHPGDVLDTLYSHVFEPVHKRMSALLGLATGRNAEDPVIKLGVFSLAGQIIYFRFASPIITRRMDWAEYGPQEIAAIQATVRSNLHAFIAANRIEAAS